MDITCAEDRHIMCARNRPSVVNSVNKRRTSFVCVTQFNVFGMCNFFFGSKAVKRFAIQFALSRILNFLRVSRKSIN